VSGGTSAAISANNQSTLICDSANLVNANTILAGLSALTMPDGTVGAPALSFTSEPSTGIYRGGTGLLNIAVLGVNLFQLSSTGLTVNGTGNFTGGISGGSF
jgi:hypothetical protein